jgi:hypothetical protein
MNGDDGVLAIVLAAEHFLDLAGLHFPVQRIQRLRELGVDGLACFRPFDQDGQVVAPLLQGFGEISVLLQAPPALQDFLGLGLVLPEIRRRGQGLESIQFVSRAGGLKDSSAGRPRACSVLRNDASNHQQSASLNSQIPILERAA